MQGEWVYDGETMEILAGKVFATQLASKKQDVIDGKTWKQAVNRRD